MDTKTLVLWLLRLAGLSQIILILGSLAIPKVLGWKEQLAPLRPLIRQMFWTYSGYIWGTNLAFGLISLFGAPLLIDGSPLAACVCGFMGAYWLARVVIQFTYFDTSEVPKGGLHTLARYLLEALFFALVIVYGGALALDLGWIGG